MKKISVSFIFLFFVYVASGQLSQIPVEKKAVAKLPNEKKVFNESSEYGKALGDGIIAYELKNNPPVKAEEVISDVDAYLLKVSTDEKYSEDSIAHNLMKKYHNNIETVFNNLNLITDQYGQFLYFKGVSVPIKFALYGDTAKSVIIINLFIDNLYNTLKLSSKQRAAKVITAYILPSLKSIAEAFPEEEIKYYGMTCIYGSKDFSSKNSMLSNKAEFVGFIAPSKVTLKFIAGDITEDEMINAADIFISDRDMREGIKKVSIVIE